MWKHHLGESTPRPLMHVIFCDNWQTDDALENSLYHPSFGELFTGYPWGNVLVIASELPDALKFDLTSLTIASNFCE